MGVKKNNAESTLAGDLQASGLSFVCKTGEGALFPTTAEAPYDLKIEKYSGTTVIKRDIVTVTARVGDAFTLSARGTKACVQDDSADPKIRTSNALSFSSGDIIKQSINEDDWNNLETAIYTTIPATYATKAEAQSKASTYGATTTGNDGYAITLSPAPTSLASLKGTISFLTDVANIGNATLNINGLGAKNILKNNDVVLNDGDIEANQIVSVIYNATDDVFEMTSQTAQSTGQIKTITTNYTATDQDETILGDATAGDIDVTLGSTIVGKRYNVKLKNQTITSDSWATKAVMPGAKNTFASGVINGKIYCIGGSEGGIDSNTNYEYDPVLDSWATKAVMPTTRRECDGAVVGNSIYIIGGYTSGPLNTHEAYNATTNTWTTKAIIPTIIYGGGVGVINGKIYYIGGHNGTSYLNTNYEYDPVLDSWATKTVMPTTSLYPYYTAINGKMYVIGGFSGPSNTNYEYDPVSDSWATKATKPTGSYGGFAGGYNGKIYCIGGHNGTSYLNTNEIYNINTNTWDTGTVMIAAKSACSNSEVVNGKMYVIGGYNGGNIATNYEYTPSIIYGINLIGTIDGTVNKTINTIKEAIEIIYNGTDWEILSKYL